MANIEENALAILRVMIYELELSPEERIDVSTLILLTRFDEKVFWKAALYLEELDCVIRNIRDTHLTLRAKAPGYLDNAMITRVRVPLDAEHILQWLTDEEKGHGRASHTRIKEALELDDARFNKAVRSLERFDYIKDMTDGSGYYEPTRKGYHAVEDNFRRSDVTNAQTSSVSISGGTIYGPVLGSNSGSVSATYDFRQLELEIDRRGGEDTEALKDMIRELQQLLATNETLDKGLLARFSALMERHSWISATIAQSLLGWAIGK